MPAHALAFTEEIREAIDSSDHVIIAIRPWARRFDYLRANGRRRCRNASQSSPRCDWFRKEQLAHICACRRS